MNFMNIVKSDCVSFRQPYMTIYHIFCYILLHYPTAITLFSCLHEVFEFLQNFTLAHANFAKK